MHSTPLVNFSSFARRACLPRRRIQANMYIGRRMKVLVTCTNPFSMSSSNVPFFPSTINNAVLIDKMPFSILHLLYLLKQWRSSIARRPPRKESLPIWLMVIHLLSRKHRVIKPFGAASARGMAFVKAAYTQSMIKSYKQLERTTTSRKQVHRSWRTHAPSWDCRSGC